MNRLLRPLGSVAAIALIAAAVIATQSWTLKYENLTWDEQTFLLMAQDVLRGNLPYVGIFDNKPPLLFFVLAAAMALFGESLETLRWVGMFCVFVGAAVVYVVGTKRAGPILAMVAGLAYVGAHGVGEGLYTSSEVVANAFVILAIWILLDYGERAWTSWFAGILFACAALTRSNLVLDAVAVGLVYLVAAQRPGILPLRRDGILGFVIGGLAVVAVLLVLYASQGGLHDLWVATVVVPFSYAGTQINANTISGLLLESMFPGGDRGTERFFFLLALVAAFAAPARSRLDVAMPLAILAATVTSIVYGGSYYSHYFLQFYPPAGILIACALGAGIWRRLAVGAGAVFVVWLGFSAMLPRGIEYLRDPTPIRPRLDLAGYLAAERQDNDQVWALIDHVLLFYLSLPPLSRAGTHPDNILRDAIIHPLVEAGYVGPDEFGRILASRPKYIVANDDGSVWYLDEARRVALQKVLADEYVPSMHAENTQTMIFQRRTSLAR